MNEDNRYRCVVCGKLRRVNFLKKINSSWVCERSLTGREEIFIPLDGSGYSLHKCQVFYIYNLYLSLVTKIKLYNHTLPFLDKFGGVCFQALKIDIPEPSFFLKMTKNYR